MGASSAAAPPAPVSVRPENLGSTPSLNSSRISLGEETVPPTGGVAFSNCAWAKAVVATKDSATVTEPDIESAVKFTSAEQLMSDCLYLVEHDDARAALETKGFELFSQRDVRDILRTALV